MKNKRENKLLVILNFRCTRITNLLDQLAICVRFVEGGNKTRERLLHLLNIHDSSGGGLYKSIDELFEKSKLNMADVVGCPFDGASNSMKGEFKGLKSKIKNAIYTHCQAPVLNLVMGHTISSCSKAEDLFGLVQQGAVFVSDSYKRTS